MISAATTFAILAICLTLLPWAMAEEFFHQRPEQHKSFPGWQEPGLWRPRWIIDREFTDTNGTVTNRDRLYIRLKSDRTVERLDTKPRPLLQWRKHSLEKKHKTQKKGGLFETGEEEVKSSRDELVEAREEREELFNVDGTWWWTDDFPLPTGRVKFETREGKNAERIRHETRLSWGTLDGYAAKFRVGEIVKFRGLQRKGGEDVPIGAYSVGTFTARVNPHRPLVSKDFLAFQ